jgi:putative membrane protein
MWGLRRERRAMRAEGLIHSQSVFPVSFTLLIALALLFVGIAAIASVTLNIGPFN